MLEAAPLLDPAFIVAPKRVSVSIYISSQSTPVPFTPQLVANSCCCPAVHDAD